MSLTFPKNIAARSNITEVLCELMVSMGRQVTFHVCDGRLTGHPLGENEIREVAGAVAGCRFVYVLEGARGRLGPIAAFIANEALGRVQLQHLIDDQPVATSGRLPPLTTDYLGLYIRTLFTEQRWLNGVTVPAPVPGLDGFMGLSVVAGDLSTVTLAEAGHRPESSRKWGKH